MKKLLLALTFLSLTNACDNPLASNSPTCREGLFISRSDASSGSEHVFFDEERQEHWVFTSRNSQYLKKNTSYKICEDGNGYYTFERLS